jgi:hypothetical protein
MKLAIKRFLAKRRLERAYYILDYYDNRRDVIGPVEYPSIIVAKSQINWLLRRWKNYGM